MLRDVMLLGAEASPDQRPLAAVEVMGAADEDWRHRYRRKPPLDVLLFCRRESDDHSSLIEQPELPNRTTER